MELIKCLTPLQSIKYYSHQWLFRYGKLSGNSIIENSDRSIILAIPTTDTIHFLCPQAWLDHWAKSKEGRVKLKPKSQPEQPSLFSEQGKNNQAQNESITVEVVNNQPTESQEPALTEPLSATFTEKSAPNTNGGNGEIIHLDLKEVRRDGGTQLRAKIDLHHIKRLEEQMEDGQEIEPVVVFYDGKSYWLADGFHRWNAHKNQEEPTIEAIVHQGSRRDAVLYSVGANSDHKPALPRSRADKRRAVLTLLNDPEWKQWSDRSIARQCKVSDLTVNRLRHSICDNDADTKLNNERKVKRGGTEYTVNTSNIGKSQIQEKPMKENRVTVKGKHHLGGQSGIITQVPNPRQAIVVFDNGERELIQLRHLVQSETSTPMTEILTLVNIQPENPHDEDVTEAVNVADQIDTKIEVNTDDILIAFSSNLENFSDEQLQFIGRAIASLPPERLRLILDK